MARERCALSVATPELKTTFFNVPFGSNWKGLIG